MPKSFLLDILDEREAQSNKAAPVGRSISNHQDAWEQALNNEPSTFSSGDSFSTSNKYQPIKIDVWNPDNNLQSSIENDQPEESKKKKFLGVEIPDGSENVWDYDATNNIIDTSKPATKERGTADKVATLIEGTLEQGSGQVVQGATSLMDNLFGGLAQELHTIANTTLDSLGIGKSGAPLGEKNAISSLADYVRDTNKKESEYYGENAKELGKAGEAVNKYGTMVVAAAPAAILAMATSGASAPSTAGLQAYSAANTAGTQFGYLTNMCGNTIKEMASNPSFQTSFIQESGHAYDEALADGATEEEAALYSLLYGTWAATVEVGGGDEAAGGLQKLPKQLKKALAAGDKSTVLKIAKSTAGEVGEEWLQGILESGFKSMYQPTPIWGGDNAIINPQRMVEEAKGAAITSGILGAGQAAATAINANASTNVNPNPLIQEQTAPVETNVETDQNIERPVNPLIQNEQIAEEQPAAPIENIEEPIAQETETVNNEEVPPAFEPENGEVFSGEQVPTQSNIHDQYTEGEAARTELNPENDTHEIHHDEEVENFANKRIESGTEQARSDLLSRDPASWDDVDVRTAQKIIEQELEVARTLEGAEQDAAYARIAEMRDAYNAQGTASGQALRQRQSFSGTPDEIESEAASVLFGKESEGKLRNMSPEQKTEVMKSVQDYSERLNNISDDDPSSLIKLIGDIANTRKTKPLFDPTGKMLNKVLEKVSQMDGGMEFLRNLATTQTRSIASDYINPGAINFAKAIRYMNMLSNPATASRNVGANTVFGTFIDAISNNMATPIDSLMSIATGQKSVAGDRMLSPEAIKASYEAGLKSWLEVSLDAEAEQANYAYDEIKGRTFKANSKNFIERVLSAFERNQGYQLKTTDQIAKGGIEAETAAGLERLGVNQKEALEIAKEEAKYRTLQNQSKTSDVAKGLRNTLNNIASVKDKQGGSYGLGDDILPFAQVPANVVKTELDLNPLSAIPAAKKVFDVMVKGENATIQEQRSAAKAFGRAANGTALVALSAILSSQGIIRYTDDDDSNLKQLHKAQGKSGLQINASAALRFLTGQGSEQKPDDKYISLGWLPQLNSLMIIGNMIYDDYKDMPEEKSFYDWANLGKKAGIDSLEGMYKSILEFPAISTITSMVNAHKYANIDETSDLTEEQQRLLAAGLDKVANTATGFVVPNALRGVAAGLDDTERDLYSQSGQFDQAIDYIKAGIPGLRETLPAQTDNYGNPIQNEGGVQNFLNKAILPGAVTTDKDLPQLSKLGELAESTGNTKVLPNKTGKSTVTVNGTKYELTPAERKEYQITSGQAAEALHRDFMASPEYQDMDEDTRAEIMAGLTSLARKYADGEVDKAHGGTGVNVNLETAVEDQISAYTKKAAKADVNEAVSDGNVNNLLESLETYSENGGSGRNVLVSEAKKGGFITDGVSNDEGIVNYLLNASASDEEIDNAIADYGTKNYKATYSAAREAGATPQEASTILSTADGYGEKGKDNGSLTQAELKAYAADNPEYEDFIRAIWDAQGWSKDFDGKKYAG